MKRSLISVLVVATTAIVLSANASAGAGKVRVYQGTLGDGGQITVTLVVREDRPPGISEVDLGANITCDDGTVQEWFVGLGWAGTLPSLPSHALNLDLLDLSSALHLHGQIQAVHGEGTFEYAIPALTADEQVQKCTTGELPWTVTRTAPPVEGRSPPPPPPSPQPTPSPSPSPLQIMRFVTAGGVRVTMTRVR